MNAGMEADRMSLMDEHINTLEYSDKWKLDGKWQDIFKT
jgi:hypothetical protein